VILARLVLLGQKCAAQHRLLVKQGEKVLGDADAANPLRLVAAAQVILLRTVRG
jgi:hypothetical protein